SVPMTPAAETRKTVGKSAKLPANGEELRRRLQDYDAKLAAQGVCAPGDLLRHVSEAGAKAGYGPEMDDWTAPAIACAAQETKACEARVRQQMVGQKAVA